MKILLRQVQGLLVIHIPMQRLLIKKEPAITPTLGKEATCQASHTHPRTEKKFITSDLTLAHITQTHQAMNATGLNQIYWIVMKANNDPAFSTNND